MSADDRRERLLQSALEVFAKKGIFAVRYADVYDAAEVSRASAYRDFPAGIEGLLDELAYRTQADIVTAIEGELAALPKRGISFERALRAGIRGALIGLETTPLTGTVLRNQKSFLTSFLLDESPGSILDVLARYTARCASNFGSDDPHITRVARQFVWDVFSLLLRDMPSEPLARWPSPRTVLDEPVSTLLVQLGFDEPIVRNSIAVPPVDPPDQSRHLALLGYR